MDEATIKSILDEVSSGDRSVDDALEQLRDLPFKELGYATVDHHRGLRQGFPEVVLGSCKTPEQIAGIVKELGRGGGNVLVTRVEAGLAAEVRALTGELEYHPQAHAMVLRQAEIQPRGRGAVALVTAGTGDIPVAEEACLTAELMGNRVDRLYDVGVAGIHRVLHRREQLASAAVVIVVAGMEGALASVVGGLVPVPVIAVPTSVGYGASFGGVAALLGMLNSCAAGVAVVNIDNGFGAAYVASLINRGEK
jgi:pyridinium-3,5-biscarboxylic acid mononucleotide synthase